jgi:cellulose synthase operon protein C
MARSSSLVLALLATLAGAVVGSSGEAHAAGNIKATKEKEVVAPSSTTKKPVVAASPDNANKTKSLDKLPPELRAQAKALMEKRLAEDLEKIGKLRDEAERLLEAFVKEEPKDSPDLPEALLKLAEIKWERAKEKLLADFKAWNALPPASRGKAPELDLKTARGLVKQVLDRFPGYRDYDLALYLDGSLASEEGDEKTAVVDFAIILQKYPKSRFATDAHMAMGESAFNEKADWGKALAEYEEVLKHPEAEVYGLAMFKSAWCLWKLGKQDEAAKRFTKVLEVTSQKAGASMSKREALDTLEDEALKALVDVFIEDEGTTAQDVYNFLVKIGGEKFAGKIVRKLALAYDENARYKKEVEAYELLRKLEPASPEGADHVMAEARAWSIEGDSKQMVATYSRLLDDYLPSEKVPPPPGSPPNTAAVTTPGTWAKTQLDPAVISKASKKIEADLRTRAVEIHARAQATNNNPEFAVAVQLYQLYLTRFRNDPSAYDVLFYVAEIEYHRLGRDSDAARDYLACAKLNPKGGLSRDALFNAISALQRLQAKELEAGKGKTGEETETDKRFAEALAFYAATYPDDPQIPGFLLQQGSAYYDHKIYDPAIKIFGELLTRYPKSKEAGESGEKMIDSLVHAKDFGNVENWARKLKALPAFASEDRQRKLDGLIVQAVFRQGEALAAKGDHTGAATAYLRAAKEFPKDERAAKACVNAVIEARIAGELTVAQTAADLALNQHKGSAEAPLAAWSIAEALRGAGLLADAAAYDERLVREYPKDAHARDAAFNAVVTRTALGDYDLAVRDANTYLTTFGSANADDADEVTFLLGQAHEKAKKYAEAQKLYISYAARAKNLDHKVEALVRLAEVRLAIKDFNGADAALKDAVKLGHDKAKVLKEGKVHAAHARYLQGERLVAQYDAVTLDVTGPELKKRLDKKKNLLKEAGTTFADCAKMGSGEWTTAALYRIGYIFEGFANALKKVEPPKDTPPDQVENFHNEVDPIATLFTEKAIDAYENGWKKAIELKIFNHWTADMRTALSRLNDVEYPPIREVGLEVRSVGAAPLPDVVDAPVGVTATAKPPAPKGK